MDSAGDEVNRKNGKVGPPFGFKRTKRTWLQTKDKMFGVCSSQYHVSRTVHLVVVGDRRVV